MEYTFKNGASICVYYLSNHKGCRKLFAVHWRGGNDLIDEACTSWAEAKKLALAYKG